MRHERLAQVIQAHQEALLAQPASQDTHEAILSLRQGGRGGEITAARLAYACCAIKRCALLMRPLPPHSIARRPQTSNACSARTSELFHQRDGSAWQHLAA